MFAPIGASERMNAEAVASARDLDHLIKSIQIIPGADRHTFLFGKTNVIAAFLFHTGENFLFAAAQVNEDGTRRLDVMLGKDEG